MNSHENQIKEIIIKINSNLKYLELKNISKHPNLEFFIVDFLYKNEEIKFDLLNEIKLLQFNRFFLANHFMQQMINFMKKTKFSPLINGLKWYIKKIQ